MLLNELITPEAETEENGGVSISGDIDGLQIAGITADSRAVEPGYLFAALPGTRADGRRFIPGAIDKGAVAVLAPPGPGPDGSPDATSYGIPAVIDPNPRRRLALMAARFYGAQPETVAAVTGTNGKSSVAVFTRQLWAASGKAAASLGTLGVTTPDHDRYLALTTLDPVELHRVLAEVAEDGVTHLALEASSHGLEQHRLDGVEISAGAFTNLSRDHLDYHETMDAYLAAKAELFSRVMRADGTAVLNADTAEFGPLAEICAARGIRVVPYGKTAAEDGLILETATPTTNGIDLVCRINGGAATVHLPLVGGFQAMNALCALGLAIAGGADATQATAALGGLKGARGRMEHVADGPRGGAIYVDYAHTPDALSTVLNAIRPHVSGKLIVAFGAGGDRDPGKRAMMGEIASLHADIAIVTDDNPRSETPADIRAAILAACPDATEIGDRAEAIRRGIGQLGEGDVFVIAGKGHEQGQTVGDKVLPFDDATVARDAVKEASA